MDGDLPPLRQVIEEYGLYAEKSLGQNFLLDLNLTRKIIKLSPALTNLHVIEIGPGPGGLTRSILEGEPGFLTVYEIDQRAIHALQGIKALYSDHLEIVYADALSINWPDVMKEGQNYAFIANLPYNIATPLTVSFLKALSEHPEQIAFMTLMFQKEVARRLTAKPGSKDYGRLSVLAQSLCETRILFDIPPNAFVPQPKVTSSVVVFKPVKMYHNTVPVSAIEKVTSKAFGKRRKMIRSSLEDYVAYFELLGLSGNERAEDIPVQTYIQLAEMHE